VDLKSHIKQTNILTFNHPTMSHKPHSLTVSQSTHYFPKITLTGAWLQDWGFHKGDKIIVTQTAEGEIVLKVTTPFPHIADSQHREKNSA
jgi:hypothetical protein